MPERLEVPRPPFLWTIDQVANLIGVNQAVVETRFIYYQALTVGPTTRDKLIAHNIMPLGEKPDWRISETELARWLRVKGFRPRWTDMF